MLFRLGFEIFAVGAVLGIIALTMAWKRRRSLAGSAIDNAGAMFSALGSVFDSTSKDDLADNLSSGAENLVRGQARTAKKHWPLIACGVLAKLCIVIGAICMALWVIHAVWVWAF